MSQANKYSFSIVSLAEDNEPLATIQRNKEWVGYGTDNRLPTPIVTGKLTIEKLYLLAWFIDCVCCCN